MAMDSSGILRMIFKDDSWGSTIAFEPGIDITLSGTLELGFALNVDPAQLLGTTFDLFDWDNVLPNGSFTGIASMPGLSWDISNLYSTGEVTLAAVPEPFTLILLAFGGLRFWACLGHRQKV